MDETNWRGQDSWGDEPYEITEYELGEVAWQPTWQCRARVEVAAYVKDGHPVGDRWPVRYGSAKYGWYAYHPHPQPVVTVEEPQRFDYDPMDPGSTREDFRWGYYSGEEPHDVGVTVYSTDPERARKVAAERAYQVAAEWDVQVAAARDRGELG